MPHTCGSVHFKKEAVERLLENLNQGICEAHMKFKITEAGRLENPPIGDGMDERYVRHGF